MTDEQTNTFSEARPAVLIYRANLLPASETFVLSQAGALTRFSPYFVGGSRVDGLTLPEGRYHCIDSPGPFRASRRALYRLCGFAPGLTRTMRRLNPVLVHAHFGMDSVPALWLARRLKVPLVVTFHGYDVTMKPEYARRFSFDYRRYLRWRPIVQKEASLFLAVSEFIRGKLISQGFPAEKISVHYVGVDAGLFTPDPSITREPIVLFAGRLVDSKGCDHLIQAMARVQEQVPEAQLVVIGDGPMRPSLESLAASCIKNYQFMGLRPQSEVRDWMNRAKVFSVPSFTTPMGTSEGFGLVFSEAQAMGLPVASFSTGGIPEAVAHDTTGLLTTERDTEGLARNIVRLLQDEALWQQFSTAAAKRARELFDLHTQTKKLEKIYDRLLMQSEATQENEFPLQPLSEECVQHQYSIRPQARKHN